MVVDPRSMLFVSGARADRFPKAFATGADLVCIDLEDAVQPSDKPAARAQVFDWLAARGAGPSGAAAAAVRLNGLRTQDGLRDAVALVDAGVRLDWLVLPKVESAADVECIAGWAADRFAGLVALIESPLGVENAPLIARAIRALRPGQPGALMLGGVDLALELGAQFGWDALLSARGRLVNAARGAGLQAWDVPYLAIDDADGLAAETRRVIALGFGCKAAIHPSQVAVLHRAFAPDAEQLRWAHGVLAAQLRAGTGAFLFEGKLVDAPILVRAERMVALAARQADAR
jgi:citrate lyase beta subunit